MTECLFTVNLHGYDVVNPPPTTKLPCLYFSDDVDRAPLVSKMGWKFVFCNLPEPRGDLERRLQVVECKLYPERFAKEVLDFDILIYVDANVKSLGCKFVEEWVPRLGDKALLLECGFYKGLQNNILSEYSRSINQLRWAHSHDAFRKSRDEWKSRINLHDIPVCSAKYIVVNMKKKEEVPEIWRFLEEEHRKHIQGNIIYSIASEKFKHLIERGECDMSGTSITSHLSSY